MTDPRHRFAFDGATPPGYGEKAHSLRLFLGYRVFLALVLMAVFFIVGHGPLGKLNPTLFAIAATSYLLISIVSLGWALARLQQPVLLQVELQAVVAVVLDIGSVAVMIYASGGVQSGLGMLIAVSIALGAMSMTSRLSLLLAAAASLAVISVQLLGHWLQAFPTTAYMQSGLLGVSYFALAALAHQLAKRAQVSELLASQRGYDLANLSQLNDLVIQQMRAGILVVDDRQVVQVMNEAAWVLLGMPGAMRHHPLKQASSELAAALDAWEQGRDGVSEPFRPIPGGRDLRADFTRLGDHGELGTLIVLEDIGLLTAQAQQMKLASLGRLTAGIAHEIRNPLGAISHAAQLLEESRQLVPADRRMSQIIHANSARVNEVVQNILKLSRQAPPQPRPLMLSAWLSQLALELAHAHQLESEQLFVSVDPEGITVFADPGQVRQVIEVLCDNAVRHFDRDHEHLRIGLVAGIAKNSGGPFIEVSDNGRGIPPEHANQLFEPFFTTRHQGTGLGLYIARQLSEANRVNLDYLPPAEGGSCFRLSFAKPPK